MGKLVTGKQQIWFFSLVLFRAAQTTLHIGISQPHKWGREDIPVFPNAFPLHLAHLQPLPLLPTYPILAVV